MSENEGFYFLLKAILRSLNSIFQLPFDQFGAKENSFDMKSLISWRRNFYEQNNSWWNNSIKNLSEVPQPLVKLIIKSFLIEDLVDCLDSLMCCFLVLVHVWLIFCFLFRTRTLKAFCFGAKIDGVPYFYCIRNSINVSKMDENFSIFLLTMKNITPTVILV